MTTWKGIPQNYVDVDDEYGETVNECEEVENENDGDEDIKQVNWEAKAKIDE